jgi:hypothetical protein
MVLAGVIFAVLGYRLNVRIELPVFAVVSTFVETRLFVFSRTNFIDELILLLTIPGLLLVVFSKEKNEFEKLNQMRAKALFRALIANSIFLLASALFVYGSSFMAVVVLNIVSIFLFYLLFFFLLRKRFKP